MPWSYRPICLLNMTGKFFYIIKSKLKKYLENLGELNDRKFEFWKGRSIIDTISKVMKLVESKLTGPLNRKDICVLVALDVANALNSANWGKISNNLVKRNAPHYLIQIIHSYLSDRSLMYGDGICREVTEGVPQVWVIRSIIWNVMYDNLLLADLGDSNHCFFSASLDDVAVIATGHTTNLLEEAANRTLAAIAGWMEANGLTLAAHKTEAVILTTKRKYATTPLFTINGIRVNPTEHLKNLGIALTRRLEFRHHIKIATMKAGATAEVLVRILTNLGGSKPWARKLLVTSFNNQLLYASPIWTSALLFKNNIKSLEGPPQR